MHEPGGTILIADDDMLVKMTYKHCLEEAGYQVLLANDGQQAIRLLEANNVRAMLLDVFMPEKDGIETLLDVKRRFPNLPIIVMSGGGLHGRLDFLDAARKFGANATVPKPSGPAAIIQVIEKVASV